MVKKIILSIFILTFISTTTFAQFSLENLKKKVQKKVENRVEKNIDKGIDKSLDKVEEEAGKSISGTDSSQVEQNANPNATAQKNEEKTNIIADSTQKSSPKILWNKYDFIPGTEIIFEDNLENEQNGEFPSKWDLYEGNIEIVNFEGENVIYFIGNDSFNQKLSEERANSVISELVGMGIESNRLTGKGWGESKPIYQNTTPEEKAQNRRVEFIKIK